jgi:nephrocystin-3
LVVTGESGGGKTALLAAWVRNWAASNPDDFVVQHYFGATPESASPDGFLHRLLGEMKRHYELADEIPSDPDKLREALPLWLAQTASRGRIVLVLDALNQVQGSEPDLRLSWLPRFFPSNVTVIASALPGAALDVIRERGWAEHDLPLANPDEVAAMVDAYLGIHARSLSAGLLREIVSAHGCRNPLFLRTLMEELRQFGSFERLPQRVSYYLAANSPRDLFVRVLKRWQDDFDGKDPETQPSTIDLVRRSLTYLWAARQGLAESEWLDLLRAGVEPLPRAYWTPLFLALEPHLSQRGGLLAFGHDFLRQAVEAQFVPAQDLQQEAHLRIADYFEGHPHQNEMTPRKAAEWPWQLFASEAWDRLEACLTHMPLFLALYNDKTKWELSGYWIPLRAAGRDIEACYSRTYERYGMNDDRLAYSLGSFLINNGCFTFGRALMENLAASARRGPLREFEANYVTAQSTLAFVLESRGDFEDAAKVRERVLSVYEVSFGGRDRFTATACVNLAGTYLSLRRWADAESLSNRALAIDENIYGNEHAELVIDLIGLAESCRGGGKPACTESALRRALSICRNHLPTIHPVRATVLNNLATFLLQTERLVEAESLALEAVAIDRLCLGNAHPRLATHLNSLAAAMKANGNIRGALRPAEEALKILVAQSLRLGELQDHTIAAAIALASLANGAGFAGPIALNVVNSILRPIQDLLQGRESEDGCSDASTDGSIGQRPQAHNETPNEQAHASEANNETVSRNRDGIAERSELKPPQSPGASPDASEDGVSGVDALMIRLDPRNLRYKAEEGDPRGQCDFAVYCESNGDYMEAAKWYRLSAEQGVARAQFNLGVFLKNGTGVNKNLAEAVKW